MVIRVAGRINQLVNARYMCPGNVSRAISPVIPVFTGATFFNHLSRDEMLNFVHPRWRWA